MFIEILFKILLFKGGVLIYAEALYDFQNDHPVLSVSGCLCILCSPFLCFFTPVVFFSRMFLVCDPAYLVTLIPACPFFLMSSDPLALFQTVLFPLNH